METILSRRFRYLELELFDSIIYLCNCSLACDFLKKNSAITSPVTSNYYQFADHSEEKYLI